MEDKQNNEIAETSSTILSQQSEELKRTGKISKTKARNKETTKITKKTLKTQKQVQTQDMENIKEISKNEIKSPQTAVIIISSSDEHEAPVTPLQNEKKRKLFSPKDINEIINEPLVTETSDEIIPLSKFNTPHIKNSYLTNSTSESEDVDFKRKKVEVSASADSIKTKKGRFGRHQIKPESNQSITSNEEEVVQSSGKKTREQRLKNEKQAKAKSVPKLQVIQEKRVKESPLPACETMSNDVEDDQGSRVSSKMVNICNKIIQDGNNNLNLTNSAENINCSSGQPDIPVEIEFYQKFEVKNNRNSRNALAKSEKVVPSTKLNKKKKGTINKGNRRNDDSFYSSDIRTSNEEKEMHGIDLTKEEPVIINNEKKYQTNTESKRDLKYIEDDLNEKVSEKWIKTFDMEESPSPQSLSHHISPRNMEMLDLNFSQGEYFLQLRAATEENSNQNDANIGTSCSDEIQKADENNYSKNKQSTFLNSPGVSISEVTDDSFSKCCSPPKSPIKPIRRLLDNYYRNCNNHPTLDPYPRVIHQETNESTRKIKNKINKFKEKEEIDSLSASGDHSTCNDGIQSILKKLAMALPKINKDTIRRFEHMFGKMTRDYDKIVERRVQQNIEAIQKKIIKLIVEMHKKFEEMHEDFNRKMKRRVTLFIRENAQRQRALLLSLSEEVESIITTM